MFIIHRCSICRPSDSIVSEEAGIEPRIVANLALLPDAVITQLDQIPRLLTTSLFQWP
jgi:hypothetical protein